MLPRQICRTAVTRSGRSGFVGGVLRSTFVVVTLVAILIIGLVLIAGTWQGIRLYGPALGRKPRTKN